MYDYIKGKLIHKTPNYIVVESNSIGYRIYSSLSTIDNLSESDGEVKIFTHLYVREDILMLYGFSTKEEMKIFELLISVSGVGPKAALSTLSSISPSKFSVGIITEDTTLFTKAQGIGKKTAQRIILELKDKIKNDEINLEGFKADTMESRGNQNSSMLSEAISALMVLGYSQTEANKAVAKVYRDDNDLEEIIKNALKGLI